MFTRVEFLLGWRYTRAERRNGFLSFIATIAMCGVALGIIALITILSIMNGFELELRERLLGLSPHVTIRGENGDLKEWLAVQASLGGLAGIASSTPVIEREAMLTNYDLVHGARLQGVSTGDPRISKLNAFMHTPTEKGDSGQADGHSLQKNMSDLKAGDFSIILGEGLASSLQARIGDDITVISSQPNRTPAGLLPRLRRFKVIGIFSAGVHEFDTAFAFIHLEDAAKLFRLGSKVSSLQLRLADSLEATAIKHLIRETANHGDGTQGEEGQKLAVSDWTDENENLFRALKTEKIVMSVVLALAIAVAAFNLLSTLAMLVAEKRAEIAILRTLGMSRNRIIAAFFVHGGIIGLIGVSVGTIVGVLLASNVAAVVAWFERVFGFKVLSPDVYYISDIPSKLYLGDVVVAVSVSLLLCLLAPLYPAFSASRVEPAQILRYE